MAAIVVNSPTDVSIDGVSAGQPMDAIRNNPQFASDIQRALQAWWDSQQQAVTDSQATIAAVHNVEIDVLNSTHAVALESAAADKKAAVDALNAQLVQVNAANQAAMASLVASDKAALDEVTATVAERDTTIIADKAAAAAALTAAVEPLNAKIAEHVATIAVRDAAIATLTAAAATTTSTITNLQTQITGLTEQIAGKAGQYHVTTSTMHEVALSLVSADTTPAEWINKTISEVLDGLVIQNQQAILGLALQKYPALPDTAKEQVLAIFGASYLVPAAPAEQLAALRDFGLVRFLALPAEGKATIGTMLVESQLTEGQAAVEASAETPTVEDTP